MWLRRWVAIMMILTCVGLNLIVLLGILLPDKNQQLVESLKAQQQTNQTGQTASAQAPTVSLAGDPAQITAGSSSALKWTTTGNPTSCTASGSWSGAKTPFGAESTGRISTSGNYTYKLTCQNSAGKAEASAIITVGNAKVPPRSHTSSSTPVATGPTYCGGRLPCYGPHDVAAHSSAGDCWGWNKDRVINISGFDLAYHITISGISSIRISSVCGHDLAPSLDGQVSAGGQTRDHNQTTKDNADPNEIPYFVGYFDPNK